MYARKKVGHVLVQSAVSHLCEACKLSSTYKLKHSEILIRILSGILTSVCYQLLSCSKQVRLQLSTILSVWSYMKSVTRASLDSSRVAE